MIVAVNSNGEQVYSQHHKSARDFGELKGAAIINQVAIKSEGSAGRKNNHTGAAKGIGSVTSGQLNSAYSNKTLLDQINIEVPKFER